MLTQERRWKLRVETGLSKRLSWITWRILPHIALLSFIALTACTRPASRVNNTSEPISATPGTFPAQTPRISINRVQVNQGAGIYVTGESNLPSDACINTELLADQQPVNWWPRDTCIQVDEAGNWEYLVALGRGGAPTQLSSGVSYAVHAWWSQQPEAVSTRFPFDLTGPKTPE